MTELVDSPNNSKNIEKKTQETKGALSNGISVINFFKTLPSNYDEEVGGHLRKPISANRYSRLELLSHLVGLQQTPDENFLFENFTMEKHGDAQAIRFTTKDDHGSLTIVNVSTFLRENQSDPQSQTRFLVFDIFNISTSQGDKTTLTYNPGSKFGFFYLTHYQHFPHTPDGTLTEVREHTSQCLCVGQITEPNKIITPDIEYSNELNAAELQKLGIEMLNFFMNLGDDYLWIKRYLTEPWDYLSDIEILSGVLNRDESTCISAEQIQHIYQSSNPLSFQEVFQFDPNDQKKNSLRYFTYLPSRQGPPIRFVRSEVIVKKDITADGKLKVIVELDRGIPVKKDTKFVDERYEKITLEHYPDQQSGLYKKSVPAATTGRKGENPLVSFSDSSFIMGEIMAANYDDVQT